MTKRFYSVANGLTIGIFTEWSKTAISVHKFRHAVFKGFTTIDAAVAFLIAGNVLQSCTNIPVHDDSTTVKLPKDFGHECASGAPCSVDSIDTSLYSHDALDIEEELPVNEETNLKQCIATDQNNPTVSSQPTEKIPVNKESIATNKSEEIVTTKQCTKTCSKPMNKFIIQCSKCSEWTHYECTNLPAYQLHLLITTTRRYTCEVCSNVPLEFKQKWEPVILSNITSENTTQEEHV